MSAFEKLYLAILTGDQKMAIAVTQEALEADVDAMHIITTYMVPAMDEVGKRFECEEYFVPELLLSGRAMKGALELLRPKLMQSGAKMAGKVVIGTVKGDLHDIGKNLVASMLEGSGFEIVDLGADVPPERFAAAAQDSNADIVCLSALLTVTMPSMKRTIDALAAAGIRDRVKVLVGGAPVTPQFAREIGADGFGENASVAVALAREIMAARASA